ncbi:CLUMA_CG014088, isoform A [Clunio marinus]|uniref:CLUMA_CG014088, isoform A n=1 Tax=Clunio marinus TaxID=568069 RepID=A0A1J1IKS8_9DIPT|nr:CLUMA_CG014088, isoform A [Clunio marinus]
MAHLMSFYEILSLVSFTLLYMHCQLVFCLFEENKKPTYLEGRVGGYVVFNCPVEFPNDYPIPYNINWSKDGKLFYAWYGEDSSFTNQEYAGRVRLIDTHYGLGKASINLTSVREADTGWYECRMSYPNRSPQTTRNGTWFSLAVDGGTLLKIPPINQTVLEYESAFFPCSVKNPETMFVTWYKDGKILSTFSDLASRSVMGSDSGLLITPTLMTDFGVFECRVKNMIGEEEDAHAYLNVQYKAKVVYAPKEVFFAYGQQAILDCHFRSNPPLTNLRWEKDGILYDPYNNVFYKRNGSLFFSEVDDLHGGKYTCTPYNVLGTEGPSPIIKVLVQHPPEFTLKPKSVYIRKLGESVTMNCSAKDKHTNDDRSLIDWTRKDGIPLPFHRHTINGGNLTIENLTAHDRGIYTCAAINEAAKIETDAELMIETFSPKAPSNLTANSTKDSITIRWVQNYVRHGIKFSIWYRLSDSAEWRTHQVKSTTDYVSTNTTTKNVSAFSQLGPPRNVSIETRPDGFFVCWNSPDWGQQSLVVYVIRWYLEPEHILCGKAETTDNFYIIPEGLLENGVLYTLQVSSVSTSNYEAFGEELQIVTPQYGITQVITIGAIVILILLLCTGIILYFKRNLFATY